MYYLCVKGWWSNNKSAHLWSKDRGFSKNGKTAWLQIRGSNEECFFDYGYKEENESVVFPLKESVYVIASLAHCYKNATVNKKLDGDMYS